MTRRSIYAGPRPRVLWLLREVFQQRPEKRHDPRAKVWCHLSVGRWTFMLTTHYLGEMYGYLGSDSTEVKVIVTRNPR